MVKDAYALISLNLWEIFSLWLLRASFTEALWLSSDLICHISRLVNILLCFSALFSFVRWFCCVYCHSHFAGLGNSFKLLIKILISFTQEKEKKSISFSFRNFIFESNFIYMINWMNKQSITSWISILFLRIIGLFVSLSCCHFLE
jgi:hypothetical protein